MEKTKIKRNRANIIRGVHPLFKFFSLLLIFFTLTNTKSLSVILTYILLSFLIVIITDGYKIIQQLKVISPFLFIIVVYSLFLAYDTSLSIPQILEHLLYRFLMLFAIVNYSYIFIKNTPKYQLVKISVFILLPLTFLIEKKVITKIMIETISITPKILSRIKHYLRLSEKRITIRSFFNIIDIISDFFIELINNPPKTPSPSEYRTAKIAQFSKPSMTDYIFITTISVVSFGSIAFQ